MPGTTNVQIFGAKDYAMRIWLRPDRLAQLKLTPTDVVARAQRAERAVRRRQDRPAPTGGRPGARLHGHHQGPARRAEGVREHHRARRPRRLDAAPARTWRASSSARKDYDFIGRVNGKPATLHRHLPAARRQRARGRRRRAQDRWRELAKRFPQGIDLHHPVRHHALRQGVDPRGGEDAGRGDGAGVPGRVPVPAELARDADPDRRGAGVADRHVRRPVSCSASRSTR